MALRGQDVLGDEPHEEPVGVLGEAGHRVEGTGTFGLLASGVVGQFLVERGGQLGAGAHHVVVDGHCVGHAGEAADPRGAQAEEAD